MGRICLLKLFLQRWHSRDKKRPYILTAALGKAVASGKGADKEGAAEAALLQGVEALTLTLFNN